MFQAIASLIFAPGSGLGPVPLDVGSQGATVTATIIGQAYDVTLSPNVGVYSAADVERLAIILTLHEVTIPPTITPMEQGFNIDFGAPLVRKIRIDVGRSTPP